MPKEVKPPKKVGAIRIRPAQLELLVSTFENNPRLFSTKNTRDYMMHHRERDWKELCDKLNSMGGAVKEVREWRKTWSDKKNLTKARARGHIKEIKKASKGGKIDLGKLLNDLERRICALLGEEIDDLEGENNVNIKELLLKTTTQPLETEVNTSTLTTPGSSRNIPAETLVHKTPNIHPLILPDSSRPNQETNVQKEVSAPDLGPTPAEKPRLRSFNKTVLPENLGLKNNSVEAMRDSSTVMAEAFKKIADALEKHNELKVAKLKQQELFNAAIISLKKEKIQALNLIASKLEKRRNC